MLGILKKLGLLFMVLLFLSLPAMVFFKDTPFMKQLGGAVGKAIPYIGKDEIDLDVMVIAQEAVTVADEHRVGAFLPGRQYLVNIPAGFDMSVIESGLGDVGPLAMIDDNTFFYAVRNKGEIYSLRRDALGVYTSELQDEDNAGVTAIVDIAYYDGWLYVFNESSLDRHDVIDGRLGEQREILIANLPAPKGDRGALLVTAEGKAYLSINGGCILCEPTDEQRGSIMEIDIASKQSRIYARGLGEVEAMYIDENTGEIIVIDNKAATSDSPAYAELNVLAADKHYGWPYCYNNNLVFSQFAESKGEFCATTLPPKSFCDSCARLSGVTPFLGEGWPNYVKDRLLLAFNGSKEGELPSGYKLALYDGQTDNVADTFKDFVYGWLLGTENWGSPFDLVSTSSQRLILSDNYAGALYEITFTAE